MLLAPKGATDVGGLRGVIALRLVRRGRRPLLRGEPSPPDRFRWPLPSGKPQHDPAHHRRNHRPPAQSEPARTALDRPGSAVSTGTFHNTRAEHQGLLCEFLQQAKRGETDRLMIFMSSGSQREHAPTSVRFASSEPSMRSPTCRLECHAESKTLYAHSHDFR